MGLFICDNCSAIENTVFGNFWVSNMNLFTEEYNNKSLCSECTPATLKDGTVNEGCGKWHNEFEKQIANEDFARFNMKNLVHLGKFEYLKTQENPALVEAIDKLNNEILKASGLSDLELGDESYPKGV